jgi:hypothetical protein
MPHGGWKAFRIGMKKDIQKDLHEKDLPISIQIAGAIAIVWAIVHAIRNRTPADFFTYSSRIAIAISGLLALVGIFFLIVERPKFRPADASPLLVFLALGISIGSLIYYAIGASIKDFFLWCRDLTVTISWRNIIPTALAGLIVLLLGCLLFYFRLRCRTFYGASEALVGVLVAMHKTMSQPSEASSTTDFFLAFLTAGVYLVVRGLDNAYQGLTTQPGDRIAQRILERIRRYFRDQGRGHPFSNVKTIRRYK